MRYYCVFFTLCLSYSFSQKNLKGRYTFFALFNFQDAVSLFQPLFEVRLKHFYYITKFLFCQVLFFKVSWLFSFSVTAVLSFQQSSFIIISQLLFFVKYFFQVFSKFFEAVRCRSFQQLFYYITSLRFCQVLFSFSFQKFFCDIS